MNQPDAAAELWFPPPINLGVNEFQPIDEPSLIMVASDRLSAYDSVVGEVPEKGKILTALSEWWYEQLADIVPNHLLTSNVDLFPPPFKGRDELRGRSMWVRRLSMYDVECVGRAHLVGSAAQMYRATGSVCGIPLPPSLSEGDPLPELLFTPTTKAAPGEHDEPITFAQVEQKLGKAEAAELRRITLAILERARDVCEPKGIIIDDTKVELGKNILGQTMLGDEVLTPDSSRFRWRSPEGTLESLDKQPVRDWLTNVAKWDKRPETIPEIPDHVIEDTRRRYILLYELLTGEKWR